MRSQQQDLKIVWHNLGLVERFSCVLFPLDTLDLLRQLPSLGYVVPDAALRGSPEDGKPLAVQGDCELLINEQAKSIGLRGRNPEQLVSSYRELRKFIIDEMDPSSMMSTDYIEIDGLGWVRSGESPLVAFHRFWGRSERLANAASILGADVTNFGLQLVPPGIDPNSPKWFHIHVEPSPRSGSHRYTVRWTERGPDVELQLERYAGLNSAVERLLRTVEAE